LNLKFFSLSETIPESPASKSRRLRFLRILFTFYITNTLFGLFSLVVVVILNPRFPSFLNSVWLPADPSELTNGTSGALLPWAKTQVHVPLGWVCYLFAYYDFFPAYNVWLAVGSFDVILSMITYEHNAIVRISESARQQRRTIQSHVVLYQSLRILLADIYWVFGPLLYTTEMLNAGMNVLLFYGALQTTELSVMIFFWVTALGVPVRMYLIYLPILEMYMSSIRLREYFEIVKDRPLLDGLDPREHRKVTNLTRTMRPFVLRPCGLHRITPSSMTDFMLAVFSNVIAANNA